MLRNRQAAQSSRERKRLEVEKLEGEKYSIEHQNYLLKQRLLVVEHEKFALRQQVAKMAMALGLEEPPSCAAPLSPSLTADLLQHDQEIKQELEDYPYSLPSPGQSPQVTVDPRSSSFSSRSSSSSRSPSPSNLDFDSPATSSDMTQHPAAMLCGLPCQSEPAWPLSKTPNTSRDAALSPPTQPHPSPLQAAVCTSPLFQTLHSAIYSTLLSPLSQLLISLKTGSPLPPTTMTPPLFSLIQWLISTPANPLTLSISTSNAPPTTTTTSLPSTTTTSIPPPASSSSRPPSPSSTFRTSLLRRLLSCSPSLARPLKDATGRALHMKTRHALRGNVHEGGWSDGQWLDRSACCGNEAGSRKQVWRLMTMALVIDQFEKQRL